MKTRLRWQRRPVRVGRHQFGGQRYALRDPRVPDRRIGEPERRTDQPADRGDSPAATVLVVDDDANVRRIMARMLAEGGFTVVEAASGAEALEQCARAAVGVVVADVQMPHMGGIELGRRIAEQWPRIQVLYVTGYPGEDPEVPGRLLTKPFSEEELVAIVRSLGDKYRGSADDELNG